MGGLVEVATTGDEVELARNAVISGEKRGRGRLVIDVLDANNYEAINGTVAKLDGEVVADLKFAKL